MIWFFMLGIFIGSGATMLIMSVLIGGDMAQKDDTPRPVTPPHLPRS